KGKPPKARYTYLVCSKAHAKAKGCEYLPVRYKSVEGALRDNARAIIEDAPRGTDATELEQEIAAQDHTVSELRTEQDFLVRELVKSKSDAISRALRETEAELKAAMRGLRRMREQRDATASVYVVKRLTALQKALMQDPFNVAAANNTLRQ